ncbi:hypothetical protein ACFPU1_14590 [Thalassorhabdus alkalitolerans]|uniref:Secreted protein n=1 Tax=Thalassorhabdus alkalitolerans TaxID=2282697 RepID=A0ABW0YVC1_9BACI
MKTVLKMVSLLILFSLAVSSSAEAAAMKESDQMYKPGISSHSPLEHMVREQPFGEMLFWPEVRILMPGKAHFQVTDLDTGLTFNVQKRAGKQHADVQPLTTSDTEIMKEIYEGKWSWKRRAVLVHLDGRMIAASMNGMPHGAGALSNGFPGHFCIHFAGSTTHRKNNMDPAHQFMVLKAAGKLEEYRNKMGPYEVVELFLTALHQDDLYLLRVARPEYVTQNGKEILQEISKISIVSKHVEAEETMLTPVFALEVPVKLKYSAHGEGTRSDIFTFGLKKDILTNRWEMYCEEFLER